MAYRTGAILLKACRLRVSVILLRLFSFFGCQLLPGCLFHLRGLRSDRPILSGRISRRAGGGGEMRLFVRPDLTIGSGQLSNDPVLLRCQAARSRLLRSLGCLRLLFVRWLTPARLADSTGVIVGGLEVRWEKCGAGDGRKHERCQTLLNLFIGHRQRR